MATDEEGEYIPDEEEDDTEEDEEDETEEEEEEDPNAYRFHLDDPDSNETVSFLKGIYQVIEAESPDVEELEV